MKKAILTIIVLMLLANCLVACECNHEWSKATCTEPQYCAKCGLAQGQPLGHTWKNATCTSPKTCNVCGATEGSATGHKWINATCTSPKTCSICGATEGGTVDHKWINATCTSPKTCKICGKTEGKAAGHKWVAATLTNPKTCTVCGATQGKALGLTQDDIQIRLIIDRNGALNAYSQVEIVNSSDATITIPSAFSFNGYVVWIYNDYDLAPGYKVTLTAFRSMYEKDRYQKKYYDMYLDNNSSCYIVIKYKGNQYYAEFGVNGITYFNRGNAQSH